MPIVDIELVADDPEAGRGQLQALVDELGDLFGSEPGGTWVKMRSMDPAAYAENQANTDELRPTFVNILKLQLPEEDERRREMAAIAEIVARTLYRRRENVHVLYAPPAKGRIGFGGEIGVNEVAPGDLPEAHQPACAQQSASKEKTTTRQI